MTEVVVAIPSPLRLNTQMRPPAAGGDSIFRIDPLQAFASDRFAALEMARIMVHGASSGLLAGNAPM